MSRILDGSYGFDLGTPPFYPVSSNNGDEALLLRHGGEGEGVEGCSELDVVISKKKEQGHCLLVMEHYKSHHVHRYMRLDRDGARGQKADRGRGLQKVSRGMASGGGDSFKAPELDLQRRHWKQVRDEARRLNVTRASACVLTSRCLSLVAAAKIF